jgi:hypothetical protein
LCGSTGGKGEAKNLLAYPNFAVHVVADALATIQRSIGFLQKPAPKPRNTKRFGRRFNVFLLDNKSISDLYFPSFAQCRHRSADPLR